MKKTWYLALSLTLAYWVESSPVGLDILDFDNLNTDLDDLKYEVEEEYLEDYSKPLDYVEETITNDKTKSSAKKSGLKKKTTANKGFQNNHNIASLKKFYKGLGTHDQGTYDDDAAYAVAEGAAEQTVGIKGNEDRTYSKGSKTRGFHRVHHKDEYKKDKVFYENDETKGTIKKTGEKELGFRIGAGTGFNKKHFHNDRQKGITGMQGYFDKGFINKLLKRYIDLKDYNGSFTDES